MYDFLIQILKYYTEIWTIWYWC